MRGVIGRAIEMGAVSSRFVMQEPASGVVPAHQAIIEQEVAMSGSATRYSWAAHRNEALVANRDRFVFTVVRSGSGR
jgi:hypothetical protein